MHQKRPCALAAGGLTPHPSQLVLSTVAARDLNAESLHHNGLDSCFIHVVSEDMLRLIAQRSNGAQPPGTNGFRLIGPVEGMRWLRMTRQAGCILIQGYLLDRPMSLADLLVKYPSKKCRGSRQLPWVCGIAAPGFARPLARAGAGLHRLSSRRPTAQSASPGSG